MCKHKLPIIAIIILSLVLSFPVISALSSSKIKLPGAVRTSMKFLPDRAPDSYGNFEIEVHFRVRFDTESFELIINHTGEIVFDEELPVLKKNMKAGEIRLWRIKGTLRGDDGLADNVIPASVTLNVSYLYPYKKVLKYIEQRYKDNRIMMNRFLDRLNEMKGRTIKITETVHVHTPEHKDLWKWKQ